MWEILLVFFEFYSYMAKFLKTSAFWLSNLIAAGVVGSVGYLAYLDSKLPEVNILTDIELRQPLNIYDKDGNILATYGDERRVPISYNTIPRELREALATFANEGYTGADTDFYNLGSDSPYLKLSKIVAINYFYNDYTFKNTFADKVKRTLLSHRIYGDLTDEEILTLFINKVAMGNKAYGFEAAAMTYFGKSLYKCNLAELAMLVAISEDPELYDPTANYKTSITRRNEILERLYQEKVIKTEAAYRKWITFKPLIQSGYRDTVYSYPTEVVRQAMSQRFGPSAFLDGYSVYTTISRSNQMLAEMSLRTSLVEQSWLNPYPGVAGKLGGGRLRVNINAENLASSLSQYKSYPPLFPVAFLKIDAEEATVVNQLGTKLTLPREFFAWVAKTSTTETVEEPVYNSKGKQISTKTKTVTHDEWEDLTDLFNVGEVIYLMVKPTSPNYKYSVDLLEDNIEARFNGLEIPISELTLATIPEQKGAFVSLDSRTGAISALVGGFSILEDKTNYALDKYLNVGSVIKPFFYALDFRKQQTLATLELDKELVVTRNAADQSEEEVDWTVTNYNNKYYHTVNLRQALALNLNTPIVRQAQRHNLIDGFANYLGQFAISVDDNEVSTRLPIGDFKASPLEIARAYAVIDNGGFLVNPYLIDRIERQGEMQYTANNPKACESCNSENVFAKVSDDDKFNKRTKLGDLSEVHEANASTVYTIKQYPLNKPNNAPRVMDDWNAYLVYNSLTTSNIYGVKSAPDNPKGKTFPGNSEGLKALNSKRTDIGGMNGFNREQNAVWFAGFVGNEVGTSFIGVDVEQDKLPQVENLSLSAWVAYTKYQLDTTTVRNFKQPSLVLKTSINPDNSLLDSRSATAYSELFYKGTEPTESAYRETRTVTTTTVVTTTTTTTTKNTTKKSNGAKSAPQTAPAPVIRDKRYKSDGSYNDDEFGFYD